MSWTALVAHGALATAAGDEDAVFARPPIVRKQVRFWDKIFFQYPASTVVIHESGDPDRILDVIDFGPPSPHAANSPAPLSRKERDALIAHHLKRYLKAQDHFIKEHAAAVRYGAIERRLYDVYRTSPSGLAHLYKGDFKLRAQTGLADEFLQAAATAQSYLPNMEKIFLRYGVPTRLTRLPFVESMFNVKARSKVGASGIWQFMPKTARYFIFVNRLVDERNAPDKATRAAAQFLLENYRDLGSWPLAITAYNHGKVGMANAAKQIGSKDIGAIIQGYASPSFGFASRNFYAEFLAASGIYDRLYRQQRIAKVASPAATTAVILRRPTSVRDLLQHTPLTLAILASLNPCLLPSTLTTNSSKPLPAYYEIKVPREQAKAIKMALQTFDAKRYAKR